VPFRIKIEFDGMYESPKVIIWEKYLGEVLEVFEPPMCKTGWSSGRPELWSWDDDDWEAGPFAKHVLELLNRG
jgi:hypothetical protein